MSLFFLSIPILFSTFNFLINLMKNTICIFSLCLIAFTLTLSCTKDSPEPGIISTIPSSIIVKEKSISGNFDSVVLNIRLFFHSDTTFADSIHDITVNTGVHINTSRFAQNHFIYFGRDADLREYDGDTIAFSVLFDDNNRIRGVNDNYVINRNYPFLVSGQVGFTYETDNRIKELPYYGYETSSGCSAYMLSSTGQFYLNAEGKDSLVIVSEGPSCGSCPYCTDTVIVIFSSVNNNTNLCTLSFPSMPSGYYPSSNDYLQMLSFIPFPKMTGKLIDNIYYSTNHTRYTNTYTFDKEGRVKTAKLFFYGAAEKLIEFNY